MKKHDFFIADYLKWDISDKKNNQNITFVFVSIKNKELF